ncbi:MAG: hypothetical protein ABSA05_07210 [Opitutaceae bacterium]
MLRCLQIPVLILLCVIAAGAQWDLVQVYAWGRMVADHSSTMPLQEAVTKTFDGEMCPICRMVAKARQQEQSRSAAAKSAVAGKVLLFFQAVPPVILAGPGSYAWLPGESRPMAELRWAPPVPPPKIDVG